MNIIIFPRPKSNHIYANSLHGLNKFGVFLGMIAVSAVLLGGGYLLGISFGHKAILSEWKADVSAQHERLELAKRDSKTHVDALTTKVGLLQAHVNRIDALGNMLVNMAGLDADEFSFDSVPGVGGPNATAEGDTQMDMEIDTVLARINTEIENREYQLRVLNDLLIDEKLEQETHPQGRPVIHGWISSYFGKRTSPFTGKTETHQGVDFAGKAGSDVIAVAGGVVTHAAEKSAYGYLVEIDHGNGYVTRYGHNQMIHVQVGEAIKRGQVIARLGSTGRSTGPHVHFEVIKEGKRIDPIKFIE